MRLVSMIACAMTLLCFAVPPGYAQNRVALVIGNDRYPNLPADKQLAKAVNDARAVADALEKIGFKVIRGENLSRQELVDRLFDFTRSIQPGDMAFMFYAGHGVAISGGNYLLPSDVRPAEPGEEARVRNMAIGEADIVADIQERKARVVVLVLDACRDNPFRQPGVLRSLGGERGLGRTQEAEGVFAIYSAGLGQSALDNLGPADQSPNSVFTRVLVPALGRPDMHLGDVMINVRERVAQLAATVRHEQYPAYYDQTRGGRIYLSARSGGPDPNTNTGGPPPLQVPTAPPQRVDPCASAEAHWRSTEAIGTVAAYTDHLERFPTCAFAGLARARIEALNASARAALEPPRPSGFLFVDSDRRYLTQDEVRRLTPAQRRIARNEIYARRGRYFRDQELANYFAQFQWYKPNSWEVPLNTFEKANVELIQKLEQ
ncbi:MAG: caspase family protein [Xanthobacteraceae bacterium]